MVSSQNHFGDKTSEAIKMVLILGESDFSFTLAKSITEWNNLGVQPLLTLK